MPARLRETKPQLAAGLGQALENITRLAKMRLGNDAKDFLGALEHLGETENCPEDVEIIRRSSEPAWWGGAQQAQWEGGS